MIEDIVHKLGMVVIARTDPHAFVVLVSHLAMSYNNASAALIPAILIAWLEFTVSGPVAGKLRSDDHRASPIEAEASVVNNSCVTSSASNSPLKAAGANQGPRWNITDAESDRQINASVFPANTGTASVLILSSSGPGQHFEKSH